jgi:DnaJ-class molecular chaperone
VAPLDDPYALLGVPRTATAEEIKHAYWRIAREIHPDRNPDPAVADRLRHVNAAYEVLSDPARRRTFDATGPLPAAGEAAPPRSWAEGLGAFIGGLVARAKQSGRHGQDLHFTLTLGLAEASQGAQKVIAFLAPVRCPDCSGQGGACRACGGTGAVEQEQRYAVKIPPGTRTGPITYVAGAGAPGRAGGPAGDLYIDATVTPHPLLTPDHHDLRGRVPVPVLRALAGGPLEVPTLEGVETVELPPGVTGERPLKLAGRGLPRPDGTAGDLLLTLEVELPTEVPGAAREALRQALAATPPAAFPVTAAFRARLDKLRRGT